MIIRKVKWCLTSFGKVQCSERWSSRFDNIVLMDDPRAQHMHAKTHWLVSINIPSYFQWKASDLHIAPEVQGGLRYSGLQEKAILSRIHLLTIYRRFTE